MRNQIKNLLYQNRLVYENMPQSGQKEQFEAKTDQTLKGYEVTTEQNVRARLELQAGLNDALTPIQKEKQQFDEAIEEMNQERLRDSRQIQKEIEFYGTKVLIKMGKNGSYEVFEGDREIDFLSWAMDKQKSLKKESANE